MASLIPSVTAFPAYQPAPDSVLTSLKQCGTNEALSHLVKLCASQKLANGDPTTLAALEIFNNPKRLPTFIEALKMGRTKIDALPVFDLILRDRTQHSLFHDALPKFVRKALLIEYHLHSSNSIIFNSFKKTEIEKELNEALVSYVARKKELVDPSQEALNEFEVTETALYAQKEEQLEKTWAEIEQNPAAHSDQLYEQLIKECSDSPD